MDTAPKDGTKFLALKEDIFGDFQVIVKYSEISESFLVAWDHDKVDNLTHWRPLPKPPKDI